MGKTRVQRLWNRFDTLKAALSGNPHADVEQARKVTAEMQELLMTMRRAELKRNLRKKSV